MEELLDLLGLMLLFRGFKGADSAFEIVGVNFTLCFVEKTVERAGVQL